MAVQKKSEKRIKKENYCRRLQATVAKYKNCLFIDADNVSSKQISKLRVRLREIDACMIMGKNVSFIFDF
jgi:ribosomal protein L10